MKTRLLYICLIAISATMTMISCMDGDWDTPDMTNPPYGNNNIVEDASKQVNIAELKERYAKDIKNGTASQIKDTLQLKATVIANDIGGNIYKQIYVQDATGAIVIGINGTGLFPFLSVGQQILINLNNLYIGSYGQLAQIGDLYNGGIGRMSTSTWLEHVKILPTHDMSAIDTLNFNPNWDMFEKSGVLVKIEHATLTPDASYPTLAPENYPNQTSNCVNRTFSGMPSNVVLRTSTYAKFATIEVASISDVTLYGIASRFNNTWQILLRSEEDIKN